MFPVLKNWCTRSAPSIADSQVDLRCLTLTMEDHGRLIRLMNRVSVVGLMGGSNVNVYGYSPSIYFPCSVIDLSNIHGTCMERRMTSSRCLFDVNVDTVICFSCCILKYDI